MEKLGLKQKELFWVVLTILCGVGLIPIGERKLVINLIIPPSDFRLYDENLDYCFIHNTIASLLFVVIIVCVVKLWPFIFKREE